MNGELGPSGRLAVHVSRNEPSVAALRAQVSSISWNFSSGGMPNWSTPLLALSMNSNTRVHPGWMNSGERTTVSGSAAVIRARAGRASRKSLILAVCLASSGHSGEPPIPST